MLPVPFDTWLTDGSNNPYQQDMSRRNDQGMDFPYGAPQPGMPQQQQQHHPAPGQPPMNVSQQPPGAQGAQQQAQSQAAAQQNRQRKRPAPGASPATVASAAPTTPGQPPAPTPPAPQAAVPPTQIKTDEANAAPPPAAPPAKKSRTNTPWTPQEEHRLKQMRDAGNSWAEIAKACRQDLSFATWVLICDPDFPDQNRRVCQETLVQGKAKLRSW